MIYLSKYQNHPTIEPAKATESTSASLARDCGRDNDVFKKTKIPEKISSCFFTRDQGIGNSANSPSFTTLLRKSTLPFGKWIGVFKKNSIIATTIMSLALLSFPVTCFAAAGVVTAINVGVQSGSVTYGTAGSVTFTISFTRNGNNASISGLSVSAGLPAGATANWSATTSTASGNTDPAPVTLTINTSATTPAGSLTFTVRSTSPVLNKTGTLTVTAKALTVAANSTNKTYGTTQATPVSGSTAFTPTGLANSETIGSVTLTYAAGALTPTSAVGSTSTITPSAATSGTFTASNYSITYSTGTLTVVAAPLTITANSANKTYGTTQSTPVTGSTAFGSTGLRNGETIGSVTLTYGAGALTTTAAVGSTSTITPSVATGGTFTASNYNITYNTGTLTVVAVAITITASNVNKTYGTAISGGTGSSAYTITSGSLQNGETPTVTITYGTGSAAAAAVGTYSTNAVVPSAATSGGFTAGNYAITYANGNIIVGAKQLTIAVPASLTLSKEYIATTTAAVTAGALSGVEAGDVGNVTVTAAANYDNANVGTGKTIAVVYTLGGSAAGNYTKPVDYLVATGVITAKALTATSTVAPKIYDGSATTGTVTLGTVTGLIGTQTLVITPMSSNYADATVGTGKATTISYNLANGTNGGLAANYSMADFATTGDITAGPADATASTLIPVSGSITANGSSTQVLTVTAKDAYSNNVGVGGATVTITKSSGTGAIGSVTDNGNGTYTATVTSPVTVGSGVFVATLGGAAVKSGTASQTQSTISYIIGAPTQIAINAGDGQSATAGTAVATAPSVIVKDANNNPVSGVSVTFAVATGGGSATGLSATTDASGIATIGSWTLGTTAGSNTLTATSGTLTGSPVTFTATGTAGAATQIAVNAGDGQSATAGTAVATTPSVIVKDVGNNPVSGVSVTFSVATGGGSATGLSATTDASGIATIGSWTLGTTAGSNTLTATSGTLTGSPVTFTVTGTAGAATQIAVNAGNGQTATVGTAVATTPSVIVKDANNNPVSGVSVTFAVATGGGSATGLSATTDASGIATIGSWTLGTTQPDRTP